MTKSIAIIGFGRFGQLLAELAQPEFEVNIVETNPTNVEVAWQKGYKILATEQLAEVDFIFLAVPISAFEETVIAITPYLNTSQVVIDLCSVKVYPTNVMKKHLKDVQVLASHPMFGPDSAKRGLVGLQVALCPINVSDENLGIIRKFWEDKGIDVLETTPELHDQDTAYSQAFTYSIARIINNTNIPDILFKTRSFKDIHNVAVLSARDTEQLFHDMMFYNPYFSAMKKRLEQSFMNTLDTLNTIENEQENSRLF